MKTRKLRTKKRNTSGGSSDGPSAFVESVSEGSAPMPTEIDDTQQPPTEVHPAPLTPVEKRLIAKRRRADLFGLTHGYDDPDSARQTREQEYEYARKAAQKANELGFSSRKNAENRRQSASRRWQTTSIGSLKSKSDDADIVHLGQAQTQIEEVPGKGEEVPGKGEEEELEPQNDEREKMYQEFYKILFQKNVDIKEINEKIIEQFFVLYEGFGGNIEDIYKFYNIRHYNGNLRLKRGHKMKSIKKTRKLNILRSVRPDGYCNDNKDTVFSCAKMDRLALLFMHCGKKLNELAVWCHTQDNINNIFSGSMDPMDKLIDFLIQSMKTSEITINQFILFKFYKLVAFKEHSGFLKLILYIMIRTVERMFDVEKMKYGMRKKYHMMPLYLYKLQKFRMEIIMYDAERNTREQ